MKLDIMVPIIINDKKFKCSITENTTCHDVIKMAAKMMRETKFAENLALFESGFGVERMLSHQTKIRKQVRSWGANQKFVLEVKKIAAVKTKMASIAKAKRKLLSLRTQMQKPEAKEIRMFEAYHHDNTEANIMAKSAKIYDKNIETRNHDMFSGKLEVMKRFLKDSDTLCKIKAKTGRRNDEDTYEIPLRTKGEGAVFGSIQESRPIVGNKNLNIGFLSSETTMFQEPIEFCPCNELNECIIYDADGVTPSYDEESAFEDDSECSSVCDFERNINEIDFEDTLVKMDRIKSLFSNGDLNAKITEDTLMDSFMNTVVVDSSSDEGLSSVGSDFE